MEPVNLIIGILIGAVIAYVIFYLLNKGKSVPSAKHDDMVSKYNDTLTNLKIFQDKTQALQATNDILVSKIESKENEVTQLQTRTTSFETQYHNSEKRKKILLYQMIEIA